METTLPMRRVRRACRSEKRVSWEISCFICSISSSGRLLSVSWFIAEFMIPSAAMAMKRLTIMAAIASSIAQSPPSRSAPPMPIAVPMEEIESVRWCHAFATTISERILFPTLIVI